MANLIFQILFVYGAWKMKYTLALRAFRKHANAVSLITRRHNTLHHQCHHCTQKTRLYNEKQGIKSTTPHIPPSSLCFSKCQTQKLSDSNQRFSRFLSYLRALLLLLLIFPNWLYLLCCWMIKGLSCWLLWNWLCSVYMLLKHWGSWVYPVNFDWPCEIRLSIMDCFDWVCS